ncbi:MAG: family 43 glycosylhydrolase [Phycisphaerae bacterium]|nr:family 43 glycosylhydrolase [Phycisphaerae bacterium]
MRSSPVKPLLVLGIVLSVDVYAAAAENLTLEDIRAHDPFILADAGSRTYYLYTSITSGALPRGQAGVVAYASKDLKLWQGPKVVFQVPKDGWANPAHGAWAPEVHLYNGKYYLFVTLHNRDKIYTQPPQTPRVTHMRATQIFVSATPDGPFVPLADRPATPDGLMTLDGTLFVEDGIPWIVYCHEWIQVTNGTVEAVRLKPDLSGPQEDKPLMLFEGSDAPWITPWQAKPDDESRTFVTDGCFLWRTKTGRLLMLWSSWQENKKYAQTVAFSLSGRLAGPWRQLEPLLTDDSGHGMVFRTFDGRLMLVCHQPTMSPQSRARLHELEDTGDSLRLKE